jgi:hypothetical protein
MPRSRPPAGLANIDFALVERVLVKHHANVRAAAAELGVSSHDLRRLTWSDPRLIEAALEEAQLLVDRAEENVRRAVHDDAHPDRALQASIYVLSHHRAARERGWSRSSACDRDSWAANLPPPPTVVVWAGDLPGYQSLSPAAPEARASAASPSSSAADFAEDDRVH